MKNTTITRDNAKEASGYLRAIVWEHNHKAMINKDDKFYNDEDVKGLIASCETLIAALEGDTITIED